VTNGKNGMPAWEDVLSEEEIQAVASYVYDQATNDKW
jgi:cytochrome c6